MHRRPCYSPPAGVSAREVKRRASNDVHLWVCLCSLFAKGLQPASKLANESSMKTIRVAQVSVLSVCLGVDGNVGSKLRPPDCVSGAAFCNLMTQNVRLISHVRHNRYTSVDFTLCVAMPLRRFRARLQKYYDVCANNSAPVAYVLSCINFAEFLGLHIQGGSPVRS